MTDPYLDPNLPTAERVADLLGRMTIEEKVGQMFQTMAPIGEDGEIPETPFMGDPTRPLIVDQQLSHFNVLFMPDVRDAARWHNQVQALAAESRLGIPVTISSDPRHGDTDNVAAGFAAAGMSKWPEPTGLAAINDPELVRQHADIARQEYLAVGIRAALHPQIDLATEPRWGRQSATFGADVGRTTELMLAYLEGFQRSTDGTIGSESVACMTKHFPGGGPQLDGEDPHFSYGREQVYPGNRFELHLQPFIAAVNAGTSAIMPYYGMPIGQTYQGEPLEEVGFAFSRQMITDLLRGELGFTGVICTDWGLITEKEVMGAAMDARAWGVEHLTPKQRLQKLIDAGCDQMGGESATNLLLELVADGSVTESRVDESVARILAVKFDLGLFENPYVDEDAAAELCGTDAFFAAGFDAQCRAVTLLQNHDNTLPLMKGQAIYVDGVDADAAAAYGTVVDDPADADIAIVRVATPYEPRDGNFLESVFRAGTLDFTSEVVDHITTIAKTTPVVLDARLDRPSILTSLIDHTAAITATIGTNGRALLAVLFGDAEPDGTLPFELPSSMAAIEASNSDVPNDTADPLFEAGHGLRYR